LPGIVYGNILFLNIQTSRSNLIMTIINPPTTNTPYAKWKKDGIRFSIRTKITFWAGLLLALASLILVGYSAVSLRQRTIDSSTREAVAIAEASATSIKSQLDLPHFVAHTLALSLNAIKDPGIPVSFSRDQVNAMLRKILIENPSFLGTYTVWEPNAFDGVDYQYIRAVAHDDSGRFIPYWVRGDDGIIHTEALTQYEVPGVGDWYLTPRVTKQEVIIAPIFRQIQGQDVTIASYIVPIVQNDTFYGIAGVDAPIGFVQDLVDNIQLYDGSANAVLFTDTGALVAVRQQPGLINQSASLIYEDFDQIQSQLNSPFTRLSPDGKNLQIFYPINITESESENYWIMGLIIPFEKITAPATIAAVRQTVISTALIILALVFLWFFAGQIVRPMQVLTNAAQELSRGNWNITANVKSNDEAEELASAFNSMTSQLKDLFGTLEQHVADRTKALTTSAEVSRRLTSILDPNELASAVVNQIQSAFNYYYAQIYLFDETGDNLVLTAGTGEAGAEMMKRGHSLPKGRGLVGRAAENNLPVLVPDTSQASDWLPNELLPETKTEAAIPITIGDGVLGVLDVQGNMVDEIDLGDITLLESLAGQVAISLQNARQYAESQQFRLGIENSGDAVFATDVKGTITYANPGFEKVYGYSPAEVIGKNPRIIKSGLLKQENYEQFWAALLAKQSVTGDIVNRHKDGRLVYIAGTNSAIVNDAGDIIGFLAVHHDITEQKKNQDLMTQRAHQQEAINTITQKIQSATTIEDAMQVAARELGHALGMKPTLVTLEPATPADGDKVMGGRV
jgi:PAS domain S-box-containing protein